MRLKFPMRSLPKLLLIACSVYFTAQATLLLGWIATYSTKCSENSGSFCEQPSLSPASRTTSKATNEMKTVKSYEGRRDKHENKRAKLTSVTATISNTRLSPKKSMINYERRRKENFLTIGISTIGRMNVSYVINTVHELIRGLDEYDKSRVMIVIFMADFHQEVNIYVKELLELSFPKDINRLIHCIRAPRSFYPPKIDFRPLWGHSLAKTQWLAKQSLDFAFLWKYCYKLGSRYYLHLADDVKARSSYLKKIKTFIRKYQFKKWSALDFGDQGSIAMLYRTSQLLHLHKFTWIFSWFYPVNILMRQFNDFHLHGNPEWAKVQPPVFSHVGNVSSFQAKMTQNESLQASYKGSVSFPSAEVLFRSVYRARTSSSVFLVIGVPTVKRKNKSYLLTTLRGLVDGLQQSQKKQVMILVFLSDLNQEAIQSVAKSVEDEFPNELTYGLINIIKAPQSYYPSLNGLPSLWRDNPQRVKWRSKQCLDYAFLFHHVYNSYPGKYYLHIEDDLLINKGYLNNIIEFIHRLRHKHWSILEFSKSLGFIGWMYRSSDLGKLAKFLRTYFWSLPVDMLCRHYNDFHLHGNPNWAVYELPLFHHGGLISSLDGMTRMATVVKNNHYKNHTNPAAIVTTSIKNAMDKKYNDISRIYGDKSIFDYFWGKDVSIGDYILLRFANATSIVKIVVLSGGAEADEDFFGGANISWSDSQKCEKFILWKTFKDVRELVALNPKGVLCKCIKIEVNALRKDEKNRIRWIFIQEIGVWTS